MDFYINLKVNFRGNSKNFLLSGSETKSWESMEAMRDAVATLKYYLHSAYVSWKH